MPKYKLDLSFGSEGVIRLHVFDVNGPESGPIDTCEVGAELDSDELRRAWRRFFDESIETPPMAEFLRENQDADEL